MSDLEMFYGAVGSEVPDPRYNAPSPAVGHTEGRQPMALGPVSAWAIAGHMFWGITESLKVMPPGCYKIGHSQSVGVYLQRQPLTTDALIELPDSKSEQIIAEIQQFTTLRPAFTKRGLLYKRGVLLWGPPGSGKTSTLHLLMRLIVDRLGGIAVIVDHPGLAAEALQLIRRIEPERQVIAILEDMDGLISSHGIEQYLALLDGESQVDNMALPISPQKVLTDGQL